MTGELHGDIKGKIAALEPSFRFLAERTRQEATASMMGLYTEYFVQQGLMIEAVNQTVRDIVIGWEKPYWPSAEYIAVRARQKQRSVMDDMHGVTSLQQQIEDVCESEGQQRWDHRVSEANKWREQNQQRFLSLVQLLDGDIKTLMVSGVHRWLVESKVYRKHFREGSAVGGCLRKAGEDERKLAKQQAVIRQAAVHAAITEDQGLQAALQEVA